MKREMEDHFTIFSPVVVFSPDMAADAAKLKVSLPDLRRAGQTAKTIVDANMNAQADLLKINLHQRAALKLPALPTPSAGPPSSAQLMSSQLVALQPVSTTPVSAQPVPVASHSLFTAPTLPTLSTQSLQARPVQPVPTQTMPSLPTGPAPVPVPGVAVSVGHPHHEAHYDLDDTARSLVSMAAASQALQAIPGAAAAATPASATPAVATPVPVKPVAVTSLPPALKPAAFATLAAASIPMPVKPVALKAVERLPLQGVQQPKPLLPAQALQRAAHEALAAQSLALSQSQSLSQSQAPVLNKHVFFEHRFDIEPEDPNGVKKTRGNLPKSAIAHLKKWLFEHVTHPYPSDEDKRVLAVRADISVFQVNNWFINARRRIIAPVESADPPGPSAAAGVTLAGTTSLLDFLFFFSSFFVFSS